MSPNLDIFSFNFLFKRSPIRKLLVKCQTRPRLLIFHSTISLSCKKFLFRKFLMTSLHVIFGLPPLIKNPGYAYARGRGRFRPYPPITACAPQAIVNFCTSTRGQANFCTKTGYHKRFFSHERARQIERT